jgi:hypothetical protein
MECRSLVATRTTSRPAAVAAACSEVRRLSYPHGAPMKTAQYGLT